MNLTAKKVNRQLKEYKQVEALLKSAFPRNEQVPIWYLLLMSKRAIVDFWAFFDEQKFCGLSFVVHTDKLLFVLYLAVPENLRSKGYGSAILDEIKARYSGLDIVLNVEIPDEAAENYEQRLRRIKFYEKNGFLDTGYRLQNDNGFFYMLSTSRDYKVIYYKQLMNFYSFGFYAPKVYRVLDFGDEL